ncbi:MAG: M48 family metallopeptidase [Gemmatimonadota bacterium]|nr:M48 family metallopeptidase [Gemmatimonadota bacterium]
MNCHAVRNLNLYSTGEEVQLGAALQKEVDKQYDILDDRKLTSFLTGQCDKLVQACERKDIEYHFAVINSEVVNAFAMPGGYCYVHLGLFRQSSSESELMAVMAHEISHVVHRHSMKRLSQMQLAGVLMQAVVGESGTVKSIVADLFTSTGMLYYSREAEREADRDGLMTMYRAGYNPQGMVDMFKKLKAAQQGPDPSGWQNLFSTHPMTDERIDNARKLIAQLPAKPGLIMSSPEWPQVKRYLEEKYPPPEKKKAAPG